MGEFIVSLCSPSTLQHFESLATDDIALHLSSGDTVHGLADYKQLLNNIHSKLARFDRSVLATVCEKTEDGYEIAFRSHNQIASNQNPDDVISFDDFTLIHVTEDGKVDRLWQGPGAYQHIFPLVNGYF